MPDLLGNLRAIKAFMDKNDCQRVVYDVYLTRKQNGNTELSKLDYSGKDYEIGEFIRQGRISISVINVESASDVKNALCKKPVHIAFYFDQSSYSDTIASFDLRRGVAHKNNAQSTDAANAADISVRFLLQ